MRATLAALALLASPTAAETPRATLGAVGGVSLQNDQYLGGVHAGARGLGVGFLDAQARVTVGVGADFYMVRPAVHLQPRLQMGDARLYLLLGGSLNVYTARGGYATFCDKVELDCGGVSAGLDIGLGGGWRWLGGDVVFATGDLPLWTFTMNVTYVL